MGVAALQVVDVQGHQGVIDEALEEFVHQLGVEGADHAGGEGDVELKARAAGQIHHHPGQGLVQGHVGVAVTGQTLLVANGLRKGLAQGDAHVLDRVVAVDVQVTGTFDLDVETAVTGDLVEHVIEETDTGVELALARAVQVEPDPDFRLEGIAGDFGLPHCADFRRTVRTGERMGHDSI